MNFTEKFNNNKFIFINSLELADDWIAYLEKIKAYMKKTKPSAIKAQNYREGSIPF